MADNIKIINIAKSFGVRELFTNVNFDIKKGERIGLVGPNGTGKSTLMKCILGIEDIDEGFVKIPESVTVGYLEQSIDLGEDSLRAIIEQSWSDLLNIEKEINILNAKLENSVAEERDIELLGRLQERFEYLGGYEYESQSKKIIYSLGFTEDDLDKPASYFSGGQKTRINLCKALVRRPDFLFLDEPTNHLDMDMLEWLEGYLCAFKGGILVVSHDRYFLDRITTNIVDLDHRKIKVYKGNYSKYIKQKEADEKAYMNAYNKQQEYIKQTEAYIDKYRAGIKSKMARGRQSQLNRLDRLEALEKEKSLKFEFIKPAPCADKVLVLDGITVGYDDKDIIKDLKLLVRKGDSIALIGENGAGKSTLAKAIVGEIALKSGYIKVGERVQIGYFSQEHEELHDHWTVLQEVIYHSNMSEEAARNILGTFLFREDAVFRLVGDLSGGEKARLALLKLFLEGNNFLILDEPTNHLDIQTREIVEEALLNFAGTYLVISHDRYFLDKISQKTISLAKGKITEYYGNYSYYKEKITEQKSLENEKDDNVSEYSKNKTINHVENIRKEKISTHKNKLNDYVRLKQLEEVETKIAQLEATLKMYEVQINAADVVCNPIELTRISSLIEETNIELEKAYEKWDNLQ